MILLILANNLPGSRVMVWRTGRARGPVCSFSRRHLNATRAGLSPEQKEASVLDVAPAGVVGVKCTNWRSS